MKPTTTFAIAFALVVSCMSLPVTGDEPAAAAPKETPEPDKKSEALETMAVLERCLFRYLMNAGRYPTAKQGLQILKDSPFEVSPDGPIPKRWERLLEEIPTDPWGRQFVYKTRLEKDGFVVELRSYGEDGKPSDDDVVLSWNDDKDLLDSLDHLLHPKDQGEAEEPAPVEESKAEGKEKPKSESEASSE